LKGVSAKAQQLGLKKGNKKKRSRERRTDRGREEIQGEKKKEKASLACPFLENQLKECLPADERKEKGRTERATATCTKKPS